jgi:hypothetical protein
MRWLGWAGLEVSAGERENPGMPWFRRRRDPAEDAPEEPVLLENEFEEVLATHDEEGARLFEAHGEALSRGDFAEAERIERRIDELEAERDAAANPSQPAEEKPDEPSAPATD